MLAALEAKVAVGAVPEEVAVLLIEILDGEHHAHVVALDRHVLAPSYLWSLAITMAEPVPGIAQPKLAETSASFTCRHPPSR